MGETPVIVPQSIEISPEHQTLLDRFEQLFAGAYEYVKQHLPEHDLKSTVLSNLVQAYDNTAAVVKQEAATAFDKLQEEAKAAVPVVEEAGEAVVQEAAKNAEKAIEDIVPTTSASSPNTGAAATPAATSSDASAGAGDATPTAK